jgi:hypothetical protein
MLTKERLDELLVHHSSKTESMEGHRSSRSHIFLFSCVLPHPLIDAIAHKSPIAVKQQWEDAALTSFLTVCIDPNFKEKDTAMKAFKIHEDHSFQPAPGKLSIIRAKDTHTAHHFETGLKTFDGKLNGPENRDAVLKKTKGGQSKPKFGQKVRCFSKKKRRTKDWR